VRRSCDLRRLILPKIQRTSSIAWLKTYRNLILLQAQPGAMRFNGKKSHVMSGFGGSLMQLPQPAPIVASTHARSFTVYTTADAVKITATAEASSGKTRMGAASSGLNASSGQHQY
jgi:hypothetical protein